MTFEAELKALEKDYLSAYQDLQLNHVILENCMKKAIELYQHAAFQQVIMEPSKIIPEVYGYTSTRNAITACLANVVSMKTSDIISRVKGGMPKTKKQSIYVLLGRMKEDGVICSPSHGYWQLVGNDYEVI